MQVIEYEIFGAWRLVSNSGALCRENVVTEQLLRIIKIVFDAYSHCPGTALRLSFVIFSTRKSLINPLYSLQAIADGA